MIPTYIKSLVKKYGLIVLALVLAYAGGLYTMRASTKVEVEREYELKYSEKLIQLEKSLKEEFHATTESVRKSVEEASTKLATIEEKITVSPDGTHTIQRTKSTKEVTKKKSTTKKKTETVNKSKEETKNETKKEVAKEETSKETVKTSPPNQWRAYGVAALDDVVNERNRQYGVGAQYDLGPINVGGIGLWRQSDSAVTVGLTLGVAF